MKLHHFTAPTTEKVSRARSIGRALAPIAPVVAVQPTTRQVTEVKLADIKKPAAKLSKKPAVADDAEAMHDFAVSQLEGSSSAFNAHHKIKHYD